MLSVGLSPAYAQPNGPELQRGINLSNWLGNAERQMVDDRDMDQIARVGFDHIRLPVNPETMGFKLDGTSLSSIDFTRIDAAIHMAMQHKLAVIIDIHPSRAFKDTIEENDIAARQFVEFWSALAAHYDEKHYPPGSVAFELINEPHYYHGKIAYADLVKKLIAGIRTTSPNRLIIVGAPYGSSIDGLLAIQPVSDPLVIYDFHFYEPYIFTHQGVQRGFENKTTRFFHDVPYPSASVDRTIDFYAPDASDPAQAAQDLRDYVNQGWNSNRIDDRLHLAQQWALLNKVRVICGEFGVMHNHVDPKSRYGWIYDVRQSLESDAIGWDLWDYADLMGIVTLHGETTQPDPVDGAVKLVDPVKGWRGFEPQALNALGLNIDAIDKF
jgi:endoglucanase